MNRRKNSTCVSMQSIYKANSMTSVKCVPVIPVTYGATICVRKRVNQDEKL